ncbi:DUF2231 domain-containing protein [Streptomyces sp. NK08204]|uniref:DUF2231 domain-containing protein n=1 Tax=Streptomyces sp. NK08204 TaxID=2873260 RepID=UPI001CED2EB6|nr:DUF2231 domain-containing protein [Streptomyces sp. NK08204]
MTGTVKEQSISRTHPAWSPIHPPIAHVAVGAYTTATVCDILSVAGTGGDGTAHDLFRAGTFSLMIATGALFLAVIAGFYERSRMTAPGSAARAGSNIHAAIMSVLGAVAIVDIVIRRHAADDAVHTPTRNLILTLVLFVLLFVGGRLGGRLVYKLGVATAVATAPAPPAEESRLTPNP